MNHQEWLCTASIALVVAFAGGCGGKSDADRGRDVGGASGGGSGAGGGVSGGAGGGASGAGGAGATAGVCRAPQQGLVRLSAFEVTQAIGALLGEPLAETIRQIHAIEANADEFPAGGQLRPGWTFTDATWKTVDAIAQDAGRHVLAHFPEVTGCGAEPGDDCAQQFLLSFAEAAYRRPLDEAEADDVLQVYREVRSPENAGTVQEGVQYGVYAVLDSPSFLYRTEFGAPGVGEPEVTLTPHELASKLSFFLTGAPPDQPLLDAARDDSLRSAEEVERQVARLLETESARRHLERLMFGYFDLHRVPSIVLDPVVEAGFDAALAAAMQQESLAFLRGTLWTAPLAQLLTSRQSRVDAALADLYGIPFPPAGGVVDADGFADVELPDARAGMLTQAAYLTGLARPDGTSVIARGLHVASNLVCAEIPPFPDDIDPIVQGMLQAAAELGDAGERQRADYRAQHELCGGCHTAFDPYGVALEGFGPIGRQRTSDERGRPIDASTTLPAEVGQRTVAGAAEMAAAIAESGAFDACLARNLLARALTDGIAVQDTSCQAEALVRAYVDAGDPTFTGLLRQIALSPQFATRSTEVVP